MGGVGRRGAHSHGALRAVARRFHRHIAARRDDKIHRYPHTLAARGHPGRLRLGGLHRRCGRRPPQRAFPPGQDSELAPGREKVGARNDQPPGLAGGGPLSGPLRVPLLPAGVRHPLAALRDAGGRHNRRHPRLRRVHSPVHRGAARQRLERRLRERGRRSVQEVRGGRGCRGVSEGAIVGLMAFLFVLFGVLGVPVPFAVMASVIIGVLLTDISMTTVVAEMFNGINAVPLLAVPFFILVGELMASSNVTERLVSFAQALVGHIRGGLAQVVTVVSMFFAGISGSSSADVAAIGRVMLPPMKREGYNPANSAALVAAASTIANMIPPRIMAIVYGAVGGVSIVALFVGGVVPGVMVGLGLMIYSYFFGFSENVRPRSSFGEVARTAGGSVLPLLIPFMIVGGILGGLFTPTEAGMVAVVYTIVVVIPLLVRGHLRNLPRDFMHAGVLYSLPLMAVAGASALAYVIAYLQAPEAVSGLVEAIAGTNPTLIMFLIVVALVIAGDFLDAIPTIVIAMPVIAGLVELGGIDPVHMGVVAIVTLAFGLITPPYGLALLLAATFAEVPFSRTLVKALPIYLVFFVVISLLVLLPDLVLWLPGLF